MLLGEYIKARSENQRNSCDLQLSDGWGSLKKIRREEKKLRIETHGKLVGSSPLEVLMGLENCQD